MSKNDEKKHWINWLVPALLIIIAIAVFVFFPSPNTEEKESPPSLTTAVKEDNAGAFSALDISNSLISTYFYGSDIDKKEQQQALENTITHLQALNTIDTQNTLSEFNKNNINSAIQFLITMANQQENWRESAKTWVNIGNIQNLTSAQQALQAYKKASELDPNNSNAWNRQGHIHRQLKQFDQAEIAYKKVQALNNKSSNNTAFSLANFGLLSESKGDHEEAEKAFLQALEIYSMNNSDSGIASTSENLASLYKNAGQFDKSEKYYLSALEIHQKLERPQNLATTHSALGSLYQKMKRSNKALTHYEKALEISLNNNFKGNIASLYSNLGILAQQNGKLEKSKEYFEKSLELNKDIKRSNGTADQYGNLAILNRNQKKYAIAEDYHNKAIEIYRENKHADGIVSQQINLGFLYKTMKKTAKACDTWQKALGNIQQDNNNRQQRIEKLILGNCNN